MSVEGGKNSFLELGFKAPLKRGQRYLPGKGKSNRRHPYNVIGKAILKGGVGGGTNNTAISRLVHTLGETVHRLRNPVRNREKGVGKLHR